MHPPRLVALVSGGLILAACGTPTAVITAPRVEPASPYLQIAPGQPSPPSSVTNCNGVLGGVTEIAWSSWGGAVAVGRGSGTYYDKIDGGYSAAHAKATVVAFRRVEYHGRIAYSSVEWFFPTLGQRFEHSRNAVTCNELTRVYPFYGTKQ